MSQPTINTEIIACLQEVYPEVEWNQHELVNFYKTIGIMNPGGKPYEEREKKLYEVIYFSSHVVMCIGKISRTRETVLLDCGCGRSYFPFFVNYVLRRKRRNMSYIGVDANEELIEKSSQTSKALGYMNMEFFRSSIIEFEPERNVNIVCALHACDTATDEALAKGIKLNARFIIAAPCCQRQVVRQIGHVTRKAPELSSLLNSKVAKASLGVVLTETLRRLALESFGYKVDMFEFVSTKYTPKNIMLRAEKTKELNSQSLAAYHDLRDYFDVKPKIQECLPQLK